MNIQIVKHNDIYLARFKKWYHLKWRYIGTMTAWTEVNEGTTCLFCRNEKDAFDRLKLYFKDFEIIRTLELKK